MATRSTQPPLPTHRRHRHSAASSSFSSSLSTTSSTSSSSAASSSSPPPSPSMAASVVPFSWEHHPGIPKNHHGTFPDTSVVPSPLPLPPPPPPPPPSSSSRHRRRRTRSTNAAPSDGGDPFAAALAECTRDRAAGIDMDALFPPAPAKAKAAGPSTTRRRSGGGLLDLYGCKSAMAVAEGAFVVVRRPPGRAGRR